MKSICIVGKFSGKVWGSRLGAANLVMSNELGVPFPRNFKSHLLQANEYPPYQQEKQAYFIVADAGGVVDKDGHSLSSTLRA